MLFQRNSDTDRLKNQINHHFGKNAFNFSFTATEYNSSTEHLTADKTNKSLYKIYTEVWSWPQSTPVSVGSWWGAYSIPPDTLAGWKEGQRRDKIGEMRKVKWKHCKPTLLPSAHTITMKSWIKYTVSSKREIV